MISHDLVVFSVVFISVIPRLQFNLLGSATHFKLMSFQNWTQYPYFFRSNFTNASHLICGQYTESFGQLRKLKSGKQCTGFSLMRPDGKCIAWIQHSGAAILIYNIQFMGFVAAFVYFPLYQLGIRNSDASHYQSVPQGPRAIKSILNA